MLQAATAGMGPGLHRARSCWPWRQAVAPQSQPVLTAGRTHRASPRNRPTDPAVVAGGQEMLKFLDLYMCMCMCMCMQRERNRSLMTICTALAPKQPLDVLSPGRRHRHPAGPADRWRSTSPARAPYMHSMAQIPHAVTCVRVWLTHPRRHPPRCRHRRRPRRRHPPLPLPLLELGHGCAQEP